MKAPTIWILSFCTIICSPAVFAWGPEGHRIVAQIAEDRLGTNAKREVRKLIGTDDLASIANWADQTRTDETAPWHFVDIRVVGDGSNDKLDPDSECADGDCVIDKIKDFEKQLQDSSTTTETRTKALKYLVHFVGDIHQPLHCADRAYRTLADDRGGNEVHVRYPNISAPLKLHGVWDSTIIKEELLGDDTPENFAHVLAKKLQTTAMKDEVAKWRQLDKVEDWALESHKLAVEHAYKGIPVDQPAHHNPVLDQNYVDEAKPVMEEQLEKAGVRLADILNGMFPG